MNELLEEALEHIHQLIVDEENFTARALRRAKIETGVDEEPLALGCAVLLSFYLCFGSRAQHVANFLLLAVPLLLIYVFPQERPSVQRLQVHFAVLVASFLLDSLIGDKMVGYYFLKVAFFVCLYLRPFLWADDILQFVSGFNNGRGVEQAIQVAPENSTVTCIENHDEPMKNDPRYRLIPSAGEPELPVNFDDITFEPRSQLVFNAPHSGINLTCALKMTSNSTHHIAFAIKSTCVDRLTVRPASGIIRPREVVRLAVSIPILELGAEDVVDDRIAIDWAFCAADVEGFSFNLLSSTEIRRRKNIHVSYNF